MNDFQRTTEWYLSRKGMLTASEIVNILTKGKTKDAVFGKTALTYLNEKIAERFMDDEQFIFYSQDVKRSSPAMRWGNEYEDTAREVYEMATGKSVMDEPFQKLKGYENYVGGSPDGRVSTMDGIIEIKCPFNPAVHLEHLSWKEPKDLLTGNPQYYAQVQTNMLITGADYCDFISYSPLYRNKLDLGILTVPRDNEYLDNLMERIDLSVDYIKKYENLLNLLQAA